ncbi:MAG: hypothetical protein MMC23_003651 [Stictis urceolatum]|nr:hypothetical protein [Stictis urceolata]
MGFKSSKDKGGAGKPAEPVPNRRGGGGDGKSKERGDESNSGQAKGGPQSAAQANQYPTRREDAKARKDNQRATDNYEFDTT